LKKKVLITGGLGYLGGRLAASLNENKNISIRLSARNRTKAVPKWTQGLEIIKFDFEESDNHKALCENIDVIIHLAALNAKDSLSSPKRAKAINVGGTEKLVRAAVMAGVTRFIYVSTTHVYGANLHGLIDETQKPKPSNPYAETHFQAEQIVANETGIDGVILRLSNVVGPPSDPNANCWSLIANDLCRAAITSKKLELSGSGQDFRDFICMTDVLRIILSIVNIDPRKLLYQHYNVASGHSISTLTLAKKIAERAEAMFGQKLVILNKKTADSQGHHNPIFSNLRLKGLGYSMFRGIIGELDSTLKFCSEVFSAE